MLYINDLHRAITFCKIHHFADDTNLVFLTNSIKTLNKPITIHWKNLSNWLNASKISLNVKKTETIIFKSRRKKYEGLIKLKLNRQRLHSSNNVKYPPFKTFSYGKNSVISSSIQSWNNAQQKPGSLKTLPSAKIKQLIIYEILKDH